MSDLVKDLREHALGPEVCGQCGQRRTDTWRNLCREEGQCDWNLDYGTHTDGGIDVFKAKADMLLAADEIECLTTRVAKLKGLLAEVKDQHIDPFDTPDELLERVDVALERKP